MAFKGTYKKKELKDSETNFVDIPVVLPDGTSKIEKYPVKEEVVIEFPDVYVIVRSAALHQRMTVEGVKDLFVSTLVSVYDDENHKNTNFYQETLHEVVDIPVNNISEVEAYPNPMAFAYDKLKGMEGYEDLIDA